MIERVIWDHLAAQIYLKHQKLGKILLVSIFSFNYRERKLWLRLRFLPTEKSESLESKYKRSKGNMGTQAYLTMLNFKLISMPDR